jgi:hypothetical protein
MGAGRRYLIPELLGRGFLWSLVGLQWLLGHLPRRVPDLARFTRDADFGRLHSVWADWLDQNLGLIESGAPWLDRTGHRRPSAGSAADNPARRCAPGFSLNPATMARLPTWTGGGASAGPPTWRPRTPSTAR